MVYSKRTQFRKGGRAMSKAIVHKVPDEVRCQSIETLKVRKETLEYLRKKGFKTINDFIEKQDKVPKKYRGNIYAYLIFGMEDQFSNQSLVAKLIQLLNNTYKKELILNWRLLFIIYAKPQNFVQKSLKAKAVRQVPNHEQIGGDTVC